MPIVRAKYGVIPLITQAGPCVDGVLNSPEVVMPAICGAVHAVPVDRGLDGSAYSIAPFIDESD